ncbi:p67-like superoxide-generating NADPH oxidase [Heterostelium album PN500]|uniref:p67-like superoxide-generating NADPH oxidase n=1 Tax=Heterostelium pallidum (strain ATCC 26659 / Pp 5 / PN500) TaxID=670386 RepID=D3BNJ5_HETP5|nr:p67-like superoxide-generating NADPH oxidase [Heterostelium album PN500]EFA76946.1 p67-like superoxide-generating NADPH oxidase [Heterostelium album PN500]|eukprot:XP_020429078.1 p67-like superoxide-generating NADPH oxidase [Heterostelium album PN500]
MLKQTINKWSQASESFKNGDCNSALNALKSVDPTSKIQYNIGIIYCKMGNYREAIDHFTKSTELDKFMAISFFMRGVCYQQCDDRNHSIVDYDEAISKLRGHEYIDYTQLGLNFRLMLAEILFNKSMSLGAAGGSVAGLAQQCGTLPADPAFREQLKKLMEGQQVKIRTAPLDQLFRPPKVSDQAPPKLKTDQLSTPTYSSSAPTSPSPLLARVEQQQQQQQSSSASTSSAAPSPPRSKPLPAPKPSLSSSAPSLPTYKSNSSSAPPPPAPPLPGTTKRLPSRPISMAVKEPLITIKCFYQDRRLIQITESCTLQQLNEKIEMKFQESGLAIRFKSSASDFSYIKYQKDLEHALKIEVTELYLSRDGQKNNFEADAALPAKLRGSYLEDSEEPVVQQQPTTYKSNTLKRNFAPQSSAPAPAPPLPTSTKPPSIYSSSPTSAPLPLNRSGVRPTPIIPPRPSGSTTPPIPTSLKPSSAFVNRQQQQYSN